MATAPRTSSGQEYAQVRLIQDLMRVQQAAQAITSTLDLDQLLERIVAEVTGIFDCVEAFLWLRDDGTDEVVLAAVRGCRVHKKGIRLRIGKEGMTGQVAATGRTYYAPDVSKDPYYIGCEPETQSEVIVPLKVGDRIIGALEAASHDLDAFSPEQIRILEGLAAHTAIAVQNAQLFTHQRRERERLDREAQEARSIQQALFPKSSPLVAGFAVHGLCRTAGAVGGDWYDFLPLSNGRWGIVLADVSGKGMAAALLMSATRGILRALGETCCGGPGEVLDRLNRALLTDIPSGRFVTMIYGVLDPEARTLTFANAGHPWPVFVDGGQSQLLPTETGLPLGLAETKFSEVTVKLAPGTHLLFYSDGITECAGPKDEEYGLDRLQAHLLRPDVSVQTVLDEVCAFGGTCGLNDDATVILVAAQ